MRNSSRSSNNARINSARIWLIAFLFALLVIACTSKEVPELLVYTYDSFIADWGAGPRIAAIFEKSTGVRIRFISKGDSGQLLAAVLNEKDRASADIVLGLDNFLAAKTLNADILLSYTPAGIDNIPPNLRIDQSNRLQPFDFGHFAIIWDKERLKNPPSSLAELSNPQFAKMLIVMDPRSSSPGLGFLAWTEAAFGDGWRGYWKKLRPNVLTMTPGWDAGYGLFLKGEAPLVLSYATSPAYHAEVDKTDRYVALNFAEGHIMQIELAGILKRAPHAGNARKFMDFLISKECQTELPRTQWMNPVDQSVKLPQSWSAVLVPSKTLSFDKVKPEADAIEAAEILSSGQ